MQTLPQILADLGIQRYDLLIFSDGSGSGWENGCGWAAALIDRLSYGRRMFTGGANPASVNFAETMPIIHALSWYEAMEGHERLKQQGSLQVHVITDSQYVATSGTKAVDLNGELPKNHRVHWATLREFARMGYVLTFHWMRRSETLFNQCADLLASLSRTAVLKPAEQLAKAVETVQLVDPQTGQPIDLHQIHPE